MSRPQSERDRATPAPAGDLERFAPAVKAGAAIASLGVLLSMIAGVSRTSLAMARRRDLPGYFAAVHPVYRVPHHADLAIAAVVCAIVLVTDLRGRSPSAPSQSCCTTRSPTPRRSPWRRASGPGRAGSSDSDWPAA